ncbi:glycosyltransferase [Clostridium saccharobutylicum]|uniref:Glycosyl transferase family 2 n=1 Tax=Clostridium saccharobutylicum TaxID=169679 RepID=A0A1S8MYS3_CLOSA|nr:glycosyltransferase [Clostridium saccharobutylicum]OOM09359.1 glycosyl transferase family 2 [Clostridium saccharobutylicum]
MENNLVIIILNYKNYNETIDCVHNILKFNIGNKIVIVDNSSPNNSYSILKEHFSLIKNVFVVLNKYNYGYAAGNNFGVRYALNNFNDVRYICIMNPDIRITYRQIFSNLIDKLNENKNLALIAPIIISCDFLDFRNVGWLIPKTWQLFCLQSAFRKNNKWRPKYKIDKNGLMNIDVVPGSMFIIKADAFNNVDLFDEGTFLYFEETILAIKLKRQNYKEAISIGEYCYHMHEIGERPTLKQNILLYKRNSDSLIYMVKKYYNKNLVILLKLEYLINILIIIIKYPIGTMTKYNRWLKINCNKALSTRKS